MFVDFGNPEQLSGAPVARVICKMYEGIMEKGKGVDRLWCITPLSKIFQLHRGSWR